MSLQTTTTRTLLTCGLLAAAVGGVHGQQLLAPPPPEPIREAGAVQAKVSRPASAKVQAAQPAAVTTLADPATLPAAAPVASAPAITTTPARSNAWKTGVTAGVEFNDNIFLSSADASEDVITRFGLPLEYSHGDEESLDGLFARLAYTPTAVLYADNDDANRVDHDGSLLLGWRNALVTTAYAGSLRRLGEATADVGNRFDRTEIANVLRTAWKPREKVTLAVSAGQMATNYDDESLDDSSEWYGKAVLSYAWTPKTKFRAAYRGGRLEVDGSGNQTYHQASLGMDWQPREKLGFNLSAGMEHRSFDAGDTTTPLFSANATWSPRESTDVTLHAYQEVSASASQSGENYTLTGLSLALHQRLGQRWLAGLEAGIESADYSLTSGTSGSGREDEMFFIRPTLAYEFTETLGLLFYLTIRSNNSNDPAYGYDNTLAGIRLDYTF